MADLLRAYLVVGTDELKRDRTVARLKAHLDPGLADFNLDELTANADLQGLEIVVSAQTMPFGPGFRLVIVHDADKLPKAASEALVKYLDDPNPASVLCLVADSLSKATRLYKAVAKQGSTAIVDCAPKKRWELPKHVQGMARKYRLSISLPAATELVNRVGESTVMLDNQLATLAELLGDRTQVEVEDVRDHVARTAEVRPWEFLDALCERDVRQAMQLYRLMADPSLIALLSMANERVRELVCARSLDARGAAGDLPSALGKQQWQVKNHARWARRFSDGELEGILEAGIACERALKGSEDDETAFVRYIMAFRR